MINSLLLSEKNVNFKVFFKLSAFMKRQAAGYRCKKSKVFSKRQVFKFIEEAPDDRYLVMKVFIKVVYIQMFLLHSVSFRW